MGKSEHISRSILPCKFQFSFVKRNLAVVCQFDKIKHGFVNHANEIAYHESMHWFDMYIWSMLWSNLKGWFELDLWSFWQCLYGDQTKKLGFSLTYHVVVLQYG